MKASISNEQGRLLATGFAEEVRAASKINRTSALENAETSAVGRALAALGLAGTEYASADEVANAITQQNDGTFWIYGDSPRKFRLGDVRQGSNCQRRLAITSGYLG